MIGLSTARITMMVMASCACAIACTGVIGTPEGPPESRVGPSAGSSGGGFGSSGGGSGSISDPGPGAQNPEAGTNSTRPAQPEAHLHKLTASEFTNSMRDLLGSAVPLSEVEPDTDIDGFASIGASSVAVSPSGVGLYEAAIEAASRYALSDATRASALLTCVPRATADTACLTRALQVFGRRAFRRPLTDAETKLFVDIATSIGDEATSVLTGLEYAVSAILQSPGFLYRVELGIPSAADGGRRKYDDFEMASRLASTLWNSVPDEALLDAAGKGELADVEGIRAQAERMLAAPRAHDALASFVGDLYGLDRLLGTFKDAGTFPEWTPTLRDAMHEELTRRIDDMVFNVKGDFLSLYDNRTVFVNNELARVYGLPEVRPDAFRRVELPIDSARVGLLGSGAFLAAYALPQRTSPTARGKFVNLALLCKVIPPPPPGVDTTLPPLADPNASIRERLEFHRSNPACATCHNLMDPIGLGLEHFDGLGRYRATDNGRAIDASGVINGAPFENAAELGARLREDPVAEACFVSKVYAHAQGRSPGAVDRAALAELTTAFGLDGHRADRLLVALVSSEAFRFVEPTEL